MHDAAHVTTTPGSPLGRLRKRWHELASIRPPLKRPAAYANWIRANYELWRGTSRIHARPIKITFDPTNICQLRCPLCPTGLRAQDRELGRARTELFARLMDEIGPYVFFIDFFNWGEPLLNPQVEELIQIAASHKIVCNMSTNLSLALSDDRIERLVRSGLREMVVSIDGASRETYETYRRKGDFDLVVKNLSRIVEAKRRLGLTFPVITWQFLVFRFNEHERDAARALADRIGVDRLEFRTAFLDVNRFPVSAEDAKAIADWKPTDVAFQVEHHKSATKHHARCGWHYMSSAINWDGSVTPCCTTFEKRDDFGTLGKDGRTSYQDVINNDAFRGVRERFAGRRADPVPHVCENCPTPVIMDYHQYLNKKVLIFTAAALAQAAGRLFAKPTAPTATPASKPAPRPAGIG